MERKQVQARREEILRTTSGQIERVGITALRIADVAAALGVSPALVIYHFHTKENLVAEAFRYAAQTDLLRVRRIARARTPAPVRLMEALRWYAPTRSARGWALWIDGWGCALRDPELALVITELDRQWREVIADLIEVGVQEADFHCDDPLAASMRITAFLDGLAVQHLVNGANLGRQQLLSWLVRLVAWELGADPTTFGQGLGLPAEPLASD